MDALLLSLILCGLIEADGPMGRRFMPMAVARPVRAKIMLACTAILIGAAAACGGAWIAPRLTPEARSIFLGAALALTGGGLLFRSPGPRGEGNGDGGSGALSLLRLLWAGLSGHAPLLIAALAVRFLDPWMAGIGGAAGCFAGGWLSGGFAVWLDEVRLSRAFTYTLGGLFIIAAVLVALAIFGRV